MNPKEILPLTAAVALAATESPSKHRDIGSRKTRVYNKQQWKAMKKRRKAAQASRRRNRK